MSKIKEILIRKDLDYSHFLSIISNYEEGEIIKPNNYNGDFNIFNQFHEMNLVIKYVVPIWINSRLIGTEIAFVYKLDLDYKFALK